MRVGSLFSGGGLGDFGFLMAGCEIVFQVEIDEYCQKILELRYPDARKFRDIKTVKGSDLPECDIITGGFPCQPFSVAGKQLGADDGRSLWPEMFRIISEVRPSWVVAENVGGSDEYISTKVCNDLESSGYDLLPPLEIPATAFGLEHDRHRLWVVAHSSGNGLQEPRKNNEGIEELNGVPDTLAAPGIGKELFNRKYWPSESRIWRVVNGCTNWMDRLKCLGNGQVPMCTEWIAKGIIEYEKQSKNL